MATAPVTSTIPASWFSETGMFDLERRAIASKTWIMITHKNRFTKPGDYVRYNIAGYPILVIKDRAGSINTFLNICRHRAFPLVHEDEGSAKILSCKYHGKLAKAPHFENIPEFDKEDHSLFKIHTHVDQIGLVWVNLDSSDTPIPWEEQFGGLDTREDMTKYSLDDYVYHESWSLPGEFNWKTLVENYNECYHCSTAHPGLAPFISKETKFEISPAKNYIRHLGDGVKDGLDPEPTYLFPFSTWNPTNIVAYNMLIEPISPSSCRLRYDFFRNTKVELKDYTETVEFFKQVEKEDKWLSDTDQVNLDSTTYTSGPLHPDMEKAVTKFETLLRSVLKQHHEKEKSAGNQIWPAKRVYSSSQTNEDEAFCQSVCKINDANPEGLVW